MTDPRQVPKKYRYSKRGFLRRGVLAGGIKFGGLFSIFILQVIIARIVGDTAQYGIYAWGQTLLFMVGTMACAGIPMVTGRFIASMSARHNEQAISALIRHGAALLLRIVLLPLAVAAMLWLFWGDSGGGIYHDAALIALVFAPAVTYSFFLRDISRSRQWLALALVPMQLLRPWLTAALVFLCWRLVTASPSGEQVLVMVGVSVFASVALHALIYHKLHTTKVREDQSGEDPPEEFAPQKIFSTAMPVFLTRIAGQIIRYSNVLLVGFLAGPAAAGAYFAAERLANLASIPKTVVSMVNQPSIAASHASGNKRDLQLLATQSAHGSLWTTLSISLVLVFFAEPMIGLFGKEFQVASTILIILVASGIISVISGPVMDILIMTGNQTRVPVVMMFAAATHVAALALLVPSYGATGAAIATVISTCASQFWLMYLASKHAGIATTVLASLGRKNRDG
jgi:O-antigen/teichoic acid export membrane protein